MKDVFEKIYNENTWGGISRSGPGSDPEAVEDIARNLKKFIASRSIVRIVDVPCGVFGWQEAFLSQYIQYYGIDIVPEIQYKNLRKERFNHHHAFILADATRDPIIGGDLVICRDLMIHLPLADCVKLLHNLVGSGYKYYAFTNFPEIHGNPDLSAPGGFTTRNLMDEPFGLGVPYEILPETRVKGWPKKELVVYRHDQMKKRFGTITD